MQKRKITVLFALLMMFAVLVGCGKLGEGRTDTEETEPLFLTPFSGLMPPMRP